MGCLSSVSPSCESQCLGQQQATVPFHKNSNLAAAKIHEFIRMNPLEFHGSKVDEDLQLFIDEFRNISQIIQVTEKDESVELASNRLKNVAYD